MAIDIDKSQFIKPLDKMSNFKLTGGISVERYPIAKRDRELMLNTLPLVLSFLMENGKLIKELAIPLIFPQWGMCFLHPI